MTVYRPNYHKLQPVTRGTKARQIAADALRGSTNVLRYKDRASAIAELALDVWFCADPHGFNPRDLKRIQETADAIRELCRGIKN